MTTKELNLKRAFQTIRDGFTVNCNGCKVWAGISRDGRRLLFWQCYGQSAEKFGCDSLKWIFDNIAYSKDYTFTVERFPGWTA